jgi:hypothetical protein
MRSPATIDREAFYSQSQVKLMFGISSHGIGDACRAGQLRFSERAGKRFFRGSWIIEWLEGQGHQLEPGATNGETLPA